MKKIFLLSNDVSFIKKMETILDKNKYQTMVVNVPASGLFAYCCNYKPDICIIHHSYVNGFYNIFDMIITLKNCFILYFTPLMENGILYNVINSPMFYMLEEEKISGINEIIEVMQKETSIIHSLEEKIDKYKEKMEEMRIVRKAKLAIMKYKNCSEDEAYRYILKRSMDERISKLIAAKKIIKEVEK